MGLSSALATALSGLRVTQQGLALTASNVSNAETPGYVRKSLNQVQKTTGGVGAGVDTTGVNRELDAFLQQQIQTEQSGASFADLRSSILNSLQSVFGTPGGSGTLETALNNLTSAVHALSTSPDSQSAQLGLIGAAQSLALQLNNMTQGVQSLRGQAENGIAVSVDSANTALQQIASLNQQLGGLSPSDGAAATLRDQRDKAVNQLSQLMDIRVVESPDNNSLSVFTNTGIELVGTQAATLSFNAQATVTANTFWNANPAKSGLGTISVNFPNGGSLDLVADKAIRSGTIAAYLQLRDDTLPQAQTQLDQVAASMSSLLSDKTTTGTPAGGPLPAPAGFSLDLSGLQGGNPIHITYTDAANVQHQLSLVRVDDPSVLPLNNNATVDPNDQVIGVDFSGGIAGAVAQLNAALGPAGLTFSNTGSTLTVLDDGGATATVRAASVTTTTTALQNGGPELPLFVDGGGFYSGAITATGPQATGFAGRIGVNPALVADPSKLVKYQTTTPSGDTTRPDFIYRQLTTSKTFYPPQTGFGTAKVPFQSTLLNFSQQITASQGAAADSAQQIADGQDVALNTLQEKLSKASGVNIDDEMAHLLTLQNAYAANARVMSTVNQMFDQLLQAL